MRAARRVLFGVAGYRVSDLHRGAVHISGSNALLYDLLCVHRAGER